MDLSSHLENQSSFDKIEEDSRLNQESHDLPTLPRAQKNSNKCGAGVSACSGCVFFLSLCSSIITVSIFAVENKKVVGYLNDAYNDHNYTNPAGTTDGCILSGKYYETSDLVGFQESVLCNFVLFGASGLGGISLLYLYGSCCRIVFSFVCGLSAFNLIAAIDFVIMLVSTLFALVVGSIITIGRSETCKAIKQTPVTTSCTTYYISKSFGGDPYDFDKWMNVAEMSTWATAGVFAIMTIMNMFLTLAFIVKFVKSRRGGQEYENELDAFNRNFEEDDDDPLLDPSKEPSPATAPQLVFEGVREDHTSFPPYNTGNGEGGFYGDNPWGQSS